ncbi:hypothetical protein ZWY2020_018361 [Hordeum vulgare]|nr:hypothetical protein ZWY2020_018361 [Hordeum vulgare]
MSEAGGQSAPAGSVSSPPQSMLEGGSRSLGLDVCPSSSPRSLGAVSYTRSPETPPAPTLGSLVLHPTTPAPSGVGLTLADTTSSLAGLRSRLAPSPSVAARRGTRLFVCRMLLDGRVPTITEKAAILATTRNLSPCMASPNPSTSCSSTRLTTLGPDQLAQLGDVASNCDIVFRGEKDLRLEQITTICAMECLDGPDNGRSPIALGHNAAMVR